MIVDVVLAAYFLAQVGSRVRILLTSCNLSINSNVDVCELETMPSFDDVTKFVVEFQHFVVCVLFGGHEVLDDDLEWGKS